MVLTSLNRRKRQIALKRQTKGQADLFSFLLLIASVPSNARFLSFIIVAVGVAVKRVGVAVKVK